MNGSGLASLLKGMAARGRACNHRQLLILAGTPGWCRQQAEAVLTLWPGSGEGGTPQPLWVGDSGPEAAGRILPVKRASRLLGSETALLVFDTHDCLDPDALAIASGTLHGGGLMVILTPAPAAGDARRAPFRRWFERGLRAAPQASLWTEGAPCPRLPAVEAQEGASAPPPDDPQCLSEDQAGAVRGILRVVQGHRRRPLVLTADRGRGKSVALAIAASRLLRETPRQLLVTAPRREALSSLYRWLEEELGVRADKQGEIAFQGGTLRFIPPDQLLREQPRADLLLVDEAAAIPSPMLETLVKTYSRVVFSTTVHGYEGTGRGFALRFQPALQRLAPGWRELRLRQPIRWAAGDPLECWIFDTLLLAAAPAEVPAQVEPGGAEFSHWPAERLLAAPSCLAELFALLVQAHYRTTPGDLRDLLDAADLDTWILRVGEQVVGGVLVAREGGFDPDLSRDIWAGRRRPRGHLLPQVLAAQAGWLQAPQLRYWRIVRIAVHPALQGRGLGSLMLARLADAARRQPVDMVGSSFGFTPDLMTFWTRSGFQPLRLGLRRDASSGCHSLLVARALTPQGQALAETIRERFIGQLPEQLNTTLADLDPRVVAALLGALGPATPRTDPQDWHDRLAFVAGQRGLAQCLPSLRRWAWELLRGSPLPDDAQLSELLVRCLLQHQEWETICRALGVSGRKQALSILRTGLLPYARSGVPVSLTDLLDYLLGGDLRDHNGYK